MTTTHQRTDAALRSLDPATTTGLTDHERRRAEETLRRVLASDPSVPTAVRPAARRRRLLVAVPVAAAAVAGVVLLPTLDGGQSAYASWSPTPQPLSPAQLERATELCRAQVGDGAVADADPVLAEQRGGWTFLQLRGAGTVEATCLFSDARMRDPEADGGRRYGSSGEEPVVDVRTPRSLVTLSTATGTTEDGLFSWTTGRVGAEVSEVEIRTATGLRVDATVAGGRFAAWWPAGEDSADNPELTDDHRVVVRLDDGTQLPPVAGADTLP